MFDQLDKDAIFKIIDIELKDFYSRVEKLGFTLELTTEAKDFIATKGYDKNFGARPLKRAIQKYLEDENSQNSCSSSMPKDKSAVKYPSPIKTETRNRISNTIL